MNARFWLRAGDLYFLYDNGDIRYLSYGFEEVVRRVYAAVRDDAWGTVPGVVTLLEKEIRANSFRIVTESRHISPEKQIDFLWRGTLTGTPEGVITFDFDGTAHTDFSRNRIGICLLHPCFEVEGSPLLVRHSDGTTEETRFPRNIAPHQPVFDIRSLRARVRPDVWAEIAFTGDIFEMEDQRNWMDASFKTYCTPLALPVPVQIAAGTRIQQSVTIRVEDASAPSMDCSEILTSSDSWRVPDGSMTQSRIYGAISKPIGLLLTPRKSAR